MSNFFQFTLDGTQAGTASTASGYGYGIYTPGIDTFFYNITITGLDFGTLSASFPNRETADTADDVAAAHIHTGARGANGGVAFNFLNDNNLTTTLNPDGSWTLQGLWDSSEGISGFSTDLSTTPAGSDVDLYFNIHTTTNPGGDIRGQFVSIADDNDNLITDTPFDDTLHGFGGNDTINAWSGGDDVLGGGDGDDRLVALGGDDTLVGGDGNDLLSGGSGADSMVGGDGNDDYALTEAGDIVFENPNEGSDTIRAEFDVDLQNFANVENVILSGSTNASATGSAEANVINGNAGNNTLLGLGGDDTLFGNDGSDTIDGGEGNDAISGDLNVSGAGFDDSLLGGEGLDTLWGRGGDDTLSGGNGFDMLEGNDGNDSLSGGDGGDDLRGGAGNDTLFGDAGADRMLGGADNDIYYVDDAGDQIIETAGEGFDIVYSTVSYTLAENVETLSTYNTGDLTLVGNALDNQILGNTGHNNIAGLDGDDSLEGLLGDDTLDGGGGSDLIEGNSDDDSLIGGGGDDTIIGGDGNDSIDGGTGTDVARFSVASSAISVALGFDGLIVTSADGVDFISTTVENLEFSDQTLTRAQVHALIPSVERVYQFELNGAQASTGAGTGSSATGTGYGVFNPSTNEFAYSLTVTGLDFGTILPGFANRETADTSDDVTNAHIHNAPRGVNGGVAFGFLNDDDLTATLNPDGSWTMSGIWESSEGLDTFAPSFGINPPGMDMPLYFNIHTTTVGGGEIRGQIVSSADDTDNAIDGTTGNDSLPGLAGNDTINGQDGNDILNGGEGNDSLSGGDGEDVAVFSVSSTDISVERVTDGLAITSADGVDIVANDVETFQFDDQTLTYDEVDAFASEPINRTHNVVLDGTQSGSGSTATGVGFAEFDANFTSFTYQLRIYGLDFGSVVPGFSDRATADTSDDVTALHIHTGERGANGGVAFNILTDDDLRASLFNDGSWLLSGRWDDSEGLGAFETEFGETPSGTDVPLYFNVHTTANPGGDIRGQIVSQGDDTANSITGTSGADTLSGLEGDDTLIGLEGDDLLYGGDGNDSVLGGDGNDQLYGNLGVDTLVGGLGNDNYVVSDTNEQIIEQADEGNDFVVSYASTYTLSANVEGMRILSRDNPTGIGNELNNSISTQNNNTPTLLQGLGGNDILSGGDGVDTLEGGTGDDSLDGRGGADSLVGGDGNDTYFLSEVGDVVFENPGEGIDRVYAAFDLDLRNFSEIERLELAGSDNLTGIGNSGANFLYGNAGNNLLQGLEGDDTIFSSGGMDTLEGGEGNDSLRASVNHTTDSVARYLDGGAGNDTFLGAAGADTLIGADGDDEFDAQSGDDSLNGGTGDDTLLGGNGSDTLNGGTGNDELSGADDADLISGEEGQDTLSGGFGDDTLFGGDDDDSLFGSQGNDDLDGGEGNDVLNGFTGDDILNGGAGEDTLTGGEGTDTAVFQAASTAISVSRNINGVEITSSEGNDLILNDIEFLQFTDQTLTFAEVEALVPVPVDRVHQFALDGNQSGSGSSATGTGFGQFDATAGTLTYSLRISGLDFGTQVPGVAARVTADTADDVTAMHIHTGARGVNGGVSFNVLTDSDLTATQNPDGSFTLSGIWDGGEGIASFLSQLGATPPGTDVPLYFNVHTTTNPAGEIRGQIVSSADADANTVDGTTGADTLLGAAGDDTLSGLFGNDQILGGEGLDSILGGFGSDTILGGLGNDTVAGGNGRDEVRLGNGFDVFNDNAQGGDAGRDTVFGGNGNDTIIGGGGFDDFRGEAGNDSILGGAGFDQLFGGDGADILVGGLGNDTVFGGNGRDSSNLGDGADVFNDNGQVAESGRDTVLGGNGDDTINGGGGADEFRGETGNDSISGGLGFDLLFGGDGADTLLGGLGNDSANGGNGRDEARLGNGFDLFNDNAQGGDAGRDTVFGGNGDDTINGGGGADEFRGETGNDSISGGLGFDELFGGDGADTLLGGLGNDTVFGGNGRDEARLGNGFDLFNDNGQGGDAGQDTVFGGNGNDTVNGGGGFDVFFGEAGNDILRGGVGFDRLFGGANADQLFGGLGNDTLNGGVGQDQLTGGAGLDRFVFTSGFGNDTIFGFEAADGEKINLAGVVAITGFADLLANHLQDAGGTARIVAGTNSILLNGVDFADVGVGLAYSGDDFIF
ncbi:CHRD domain-containing protein [Shimia sp.]|uniref:CHRD domain-containing protein n=1 Tax=Shimia sp. TaxID=1954381 RepID=UPI00329A2A78